jgi:PKD repeat protein
MKNEKQFILRRRSILLLFLTLFSCSIGFSQSPLERLVQEQGATSISLNVENSRVVSNEFKSYVQDYVLFQYDAAVSSRIRTEAPNAIELVVPTSRGNKTLQLVKQEVTSPDYRIESSSGNTTINGPVGTHYRGIIKGEAGSMAAVSFFEEDISILASNRTDGNFTINKIPEDGRFISYFDTDLLQEQSFECHTEDPEQIPEFLQNRRLMDEAQLRGSGPCIRVHFEADNALFTLRGTVAATAAFVEAIYNQVIILYANENLNTVISFIHVWDTPDPFGFSSSGEAIDDLQAYFLTGATLNGDLGHLVAVDPGGLGGVARGIGVLCLNEDSRLAYSDISNSFLNVPAYSFTVMVVAHEIGHNLGSPHTHGCYWNGNGTQIDDCGNIGNASPEGSACYNRFLPIVPAAGGTIMSYCHLNAVGVNLSLGFGSQPGDLIRTFVNGAPCLSACPVFADCDPPYQIKVDPITTTSATVSWFHATVSNFEVILIQDGDTVSETTVNTNSIVLNGLISGSKYQVYVRTLCAGGASSDFIYERFATVCNTVYSLPYIEFFESNDWEVGKYQLDPCWTSNLSDDNYGWTVGQFTTSSALTGPSGDHSSGFGKYPYAEASLGLVNQEAELISPLIDLTGSDKPFATFWYHMYGASINRLRVHVKEEGTETWTLLQTISGQQQISEEDEWLEEQISLTAYEDKVIQLKFTSRKGADFAGDIAIDDFIVTDSSLTDLSITNIFAPESGCGVGASESVSITLKNSGYQVFPTGTTINLSRSLNGGVAVVQPLVLASNLNPGASINFTFSGTFNLSNPGEYIVSVSLSVAGDLVAQNNTRSKQVINKPIIDFYPYNQSFESGSDWTSGGIVSSWALGTPAKSIITGASDGNNAWVTGGLGLGQYNADEESFIEGPCFDFTNLENPTIQFDVWWEIETIWEGATFQYSTDQGNNWVTLGSADDENWFNADTITTIPLSDGWSGTEDGDPTFTGSGGWVTVSHDLTGLDNEPSVFMRVFFKTDGFVQFDGIAVDNFTVDGDFTPPGCHYVSLSATTCDPDEAGVVVVTLQDVNACDSIITTTTTLLQSYSTIIERKVCDADAVGTQVTTFTALTGCDSVVTVNSVLAPSFDITVNETTCNPANVGTFIIDGLVSQYGCDSVVTVVTTLADPFEVTVNATTCDADEVGTSVETLTAVDGCDSIVTTITSLILPIEVTINDVTCNPDLVGTLVQNLIAASGCDSIVTTITTFEAIDADFTFTVSGAQVIFTGANSSGLDYNWDFGDGEGVAFNQFPTHFYTEDGVFAVELIVSNEGCESDTVTKNVTLTSTAIDLVSFIESISIYPNPNRGQFTVELNGLNVNKELVFTLFDLTGSEMDSRVVNFNSYAKEIYQMNTLASGVYFLRIQSDNQISTYKVNVLK